jgi:hypothetical protein
MMMELEDALPTTIESISKENKNGNDFIALGEEINSMNDTTYRARVFILAPDNEWRDLATGNFLISFAKKDEESSDSAESQPDKVISSYNISIDVD